jgi:tetratricopeptide (TPR) repeat protein
MSGIAQLVCGEIAAKVSSLNEVEQLSQQLGHVTGEGSARIYRGLRSLLDTGNLSDFETFAQWYEDFCRRHGFPWDVVAHQWMGMSRFWKGEWDEAIPPLKSATSPRPWGALWGFFFMAKAYLGDSDALELYEHVEANLPKDGVQTWFFRWGNLFGAIEGLTVLGKKELAFGLYPLAVQLIETGAVVNYITTDLPQKAAGMAASAGRRWDVAHEHFRAALEHADRVPHRLQQAEVRRWYARSLLDRNAVGDREKAEALIEGAITRYREIGMSRHAELARELALAKP